MIEKISEWTDFTRRGRMERNMRPAMLRRQKRLARGRPLLFPCRIDSDQIFDLYYDRQIMDVDDRLGHWVPVPGDAER